MPGVIDRQMVAENVLDRLDDLEATMRDILNDALTSQAAMPDQPTWTGISGWVATGTTLRDVNGYIVLDATIPSIVVAAGGHFASADYIAGISGFDINGGVAEFNNVTIRGTIIATTGAIGGWTIGATDLVAGSGANTVGLDSGGTNPAIYAGSATPGSAPFRVTQAGVLFAQGATIQSAASGARVVLDATGIKGYDATTQRYAILTDGSGWLGDSTIFSWTTAGVVSLNGSAVMPNTITGGKVNFFNVPVMDGLVLTNNSPTAGKVAWNSFALTYQGISYTIDAGNTINKWIWWNKATSTTVLQTAATPPSSANDQFIIAVNTSGTTSHEIFANIIYADYISVVNLAAVSANMGALHVDGVLDIGAAGGIYQGTGTFAAPTTGLKIWNDGGVGRLATYNATVAQVYFGTDGKLYAGAGVVTLDSDGVTIAVTGAYSSAASLKFTSPDGLSSELYNNVVHLGSNYTRLDVKDLTDADATLALGVASDADKYSEFYISCTPNVANSGVLFNVHGEAGNQYFLWKIYSAGGDDAEKLDTTGLYILKGLHVGAVSGDPGDNNIIVDGGVNVGTATGATAGQIRASGAAMFSGVTANQFAQQYTAALADHGKVKLGLDAGEWAFVFICDSTYASMAIFCLNGALHTVNEVSDPTGYWTPTEDTDNKNNIYWDAGNARYELNNESAYNNNYRIWLMRVS